MSRRTTITVAGRELPCYPTMGAMVRYKQMTGKEVTDISGDISEIGSYLYCSVASACAREKIEFEMEFLDFADAIDIETLNAWAASINEDPAESKKKTVKKQ